MPKLNWTINHDHFEAVTNHGTYEVGDWGRNSAVVTIPGRVGLLTVSPFDAGKEVAEAFHSARLRDDPMQTLAILGQENDNG